MEKPEDFIDVYEFTQLYGSLKENPARVIFDQVVKICIRLQNFGIFHRDIKDENILLNVNTLEAKLIDFGCAIEASTDDTFLSFSGTPEFAAPEVRQKRGYQADSSTSWTLGVLLYVLLFGDTPFPGVSEAEVGQTLSELSLCFPKPFLSPLIFSSNPIWFSGTLISVSSPKININH